MDFQSAIQMCPQKGFAYLGKADCQRYEGAYREAIKTYSMAIQFDISIRNIALLKKSITLFEARDYE